MAPQVLNIMREKECHVDVLLFLCCIVVTHVEFPPAPPLARFRRFHNASNTIKKDGISGT